eukprot:TRINITY_DN9613_c0_g1_i2.p1 TRINITY_DN9613_c0_g1~~TRINITY_DN9613_c0_g1_i2.p1  ORF type:complete len:123 (-),score=41.16 TRINITY_DN9613_c0_g1_i2:43-411(-)
MCFFFFSSRRRHTRCREVSWARRCVQETVSEECIEKIWETVSHSIGNISIAFITSMKLLIWMLFQNKPPKTMEVQYPSKCPEMFDLEWLRVVNEDYEVADKIKTQELEDQVQISQGTLMNFK